MICRMMNTTIARATNPSKEVITERDVDGVLNAKAFILDRPNSDLVSSRKSR